MSQVHLTLKSKTLLYNQLTFFKAKVIVPKISCLDCRSGFSFFKLLILHFFTYKLSINLVQQILLTKIVAVNKSFLYFNAVSKFTIVKPKFKFFFPGVSSNSLLKKNLLLVANFSFLKFLDLKAVLTRFLYFSIKNSLQFMFFFLLLIYL
uniref:Transmembrane protein n=1 Tax=Spongospora subterranea TaxID=70186 RepID=A0A096XTY3_9EUKA|nr:hypothetical protein [Spongospora subterranea]AIK19932.1 hypothetical protein [Spongospora subterranea]